jgi:hypothetical protein
MHRVSVVPHVVRRIRGRSRLVALCVGVCVLETMLVSAIAPRALGLATQGSAPPPFDLFHDLRWIVVYHETWLGFALELAGFVVVRSTLIAVLVRAAWPRGLRREPWAVTLRRSVIYVVAVAVLLAPWVGVMFALAVVSLSWLFFVAVPVVLMLSVLVAGGAVSGAAWRRTISWRTAGVVLLAFLAVTVFASVITTCAPAWRLPVAVVAGVANAWLWVRLVAAVLQPRLKPKPVPVALIGIVGVFVLVVGGTVAGFRLSRHSVVRSTPAAAAAAAATAGDDW